MKNLFKIILIFTMVFTVGGCSKSSSKKDCKVWGKIDGESVSFKQGYVSTNDYGQYRFTLYDLGDTIPTFYLTIDPDILEKGAVISTDDDSKLTNSDLNIKDVKFTYQDGIEENMFSGYMFDIYNCSDTSSSDWTLTITSYDEHYIKGTIEGKFGANHEKSKYGPYETKVLSIDVEFCLTLKLTDIDDTDEYEHYNSNSSSSNDSSYSGGSSYNYTYDDDDDDYTDSYVSSKKTCTKCGGSGKISRTCYGPNYGNNSLDTSYNCTSVCPLCGGTGYTY